MNLEIVLSATSLFGLSDGFQIWMKRKPTEATKYKQAITDYMAKLKEECSRIIGYPFAISVLYNAFTEASNREFFLDNDKFGFDALCADSGGLQMMTRGMALTDDKKKQIYQQQKGADYAFCFDELPAVAVADNARANAGAKLYQAHRLRDCAIATANNINHQIEALRDSDTKVFYIVQSNSVESAIEWVQYGMPIIEHPDRLCGFSMAWASLGNGELEAIDTMISFATIHAQFGQYDRMHLLGVGAVNRMIPVLPFMMNGLLPKDITISFDSATLSGNWIFGRLLTDKGMLSFDTIYKAKTILPPVMEEIFPFIHQYLSFDQEKATDIVIGNFNRISALRNTFLESNEEIAVSLFVVLSTLWQVKNFCSLLLEEYQTSHIAHAFANIKTLEEAMQTRDHLVSHLTSKRVKSHQSTIEGFLS